MKTQTGGNGKRLIYETMGEKQTSKFLQISGSAN